MTGCPSVLFPSLPLLSPPEAFLLSVRVEREQDSPFWLAVCECNGGTDLAWVLPESARAQTSMRSEFEGHVLRARLTYRFSLAVHEGQNLTCVHRYGRDVREERTVHVPRFGELAVVVRRPCDRSARPGLRDAALILPQKSQP